jgi:hypothetical protein
MRKIATDNPRTTDQSPARSANADHNRRDEINDYWNGSAYDERGTVWLYWVIGIAVVAIVALGMWAA